jgi:hypothetical protein
MPVPNPDHLLDQADRLITAPIGGAPRQINLRRAISSAYYAIFHAVATEAADVIVGRTKRDTSIYQLVYRSINHNSLRKLCEIFENKKPPTKYKEYFPKSGFDSNLKNLAAAFVELQQMRNNADYDPLYRVSSSDAVLVVATSRAALNSLRNTSRARRKEFVALAVFRPR